MSFPGLAQTNRLSSHRAQYWSIHRAERIDSRSHRSLPSPLSPPMKMTLICLDLLMPSTQLWSEIAAQDHHAWFSHFLPPIPDGSRNRERCLKFYKRFLFSASPAATATWLLHYFVFLISLQQERSQYIRHRYRHLVNPPQATILPPISFLSAGSAPVPSNAAQQSAHVWPAHLYQASRDTLPRWFILLLVNAKFT